MADYNINAVDRKVSYTGSAGVGPYAFSFEILVEDDIAVYFNETLLTKTTDYSVTINANGTGSVTLVVNVGGNIPATPDADDLVVILGAKDIERTTDFVTAGDLRAAALNEQLDALTIFMQQIKEEVDRSVKAPAFDPTGISMTLPKKASRVNAFIAFDANGDVSAAVPSDDVTTLAEVATDIATLADIEDGTDATDAIQTVAGISTDVTTVAGVDAQITLLGTADAIADMNTLGTAAIVADLDAVADKATEIGRLGTADAVADLAILGTADVVADMNTLGTADVVADMNTLGTAATVADMAALADVTSQITLLGTADAIADMNTLGTADVVADMNTLGTAAIVADMDALADITSDISIVAGDSADIQTLADNIGTISAKANAGANSDITSLSGLTTALSIAQGGTGATTLAGANIVASNANTTFTAAQRGSTLTDTSNTGSVTLDFDASQNFVLTLTGNVTLANPSTEAVGQSGFIVAIQDGTGGRTLSLGTDYETAGGAGITLSSAASATDIIPYVVAASNRILLGAPQLAFS